MRIALALCIALAATVAGCSGDGGTAVPRPRAFARTEPYGTAASHYTLPGVKLSVNDGAAVTLPRPDWLNASFVRYNATMHLAANRFDSNEALAEAISNRAERTSLNLAGRRARVEEFVSDGGFRIQLTRTMEPSPIPLQFMAVDSNRVFVSGAVAFSGPVEPADSMAEVLADMSRILIESLNSLESWQ